MKLDLSSVLAGIRRFKGLSCADAETLCGISENRIGRFDNKASVALTLPEIQQYADALGATVEIHISALGTKWVVPLSVEASEGAGE